VILLLTGIWIGSVGGPPPPGILAVAFSNVAVLAVFAWGYWIDRLRPVRSPLSAESKGAAYAGGIQ